MTISSIIPALLAEAARLTVDDDARRWAAMVDRLPAALAAEHERAERAVGIAQRNADRVRHSIAIEENLAADCDALAQKLAEAERAAALSDDAWRSTVRSLEKELQQARTERDYATERHDVLARQVEELQAQAIRDNEALTRMQNAGYAAEARMEAMGRVVEAARNLTDVMAPRGRVTFDAMAFACEVSWLNDALAALTDAKGKE